MKNPNWGCGGCIFSGIEGLVARILLIALGGGVIYAGDFLGRTMAIPYRVSIVGGLIVGGVAVSCYIYAREKATRQKKDQI